MTEARLIMWSAIIILTLSIVLKDKRNLGSAHETKHQQNDKE